MVNEQKAKAYDEALERARKMLNMILDNELLGFPDQIREIFPQLKESDDERIRKQLVDIVAFIPEANFKSASREDCRTYLEKQKEGVIDTSEDEKMLQIIIQGFKNWKVNGMESFNGTKIDDILAYLEKRKYNRMQPVYDNQESFESALDKAWKAYNDCGSRTVDSCEDDYIESAYAKGFREGYLFGLEKQKEQKPIKVGENAYFDPNIDMWFIKEEQKSIEWSDNFEQNIRKLLHDKLTWHSEDGSVSSTVFIDDKTLKDIINGIWFYVGKEALKYPGKELNVTEWSEEDKRMLSRCIKSVECSKQFADSETYKAAKDVEMNWLEFLPKRKNLPPKQEWSEEDKGLIDLAVDAVENFYNGGIRSKIINLLKSIHPSWKPSEEQMEALKDAVKLFKETHFEKFHYKIESLYEQLLKIYERGLSA